MEFLFLALADVLNIHDEQIREHGGLVGIRDEGLLESALARAENVLFYVQDADIFDIAASLGFGLARNHPFMDGNKRTSFVVCLTTLSLNGYDLEASSDELLTVWQSLAAGETSEKELRDWLRIHSGKA